MAQKDRTSLQIAFCLCIVGCEVPHGEQVADRMEAAVERSPLPISPIGDYSQYYFEHEDGAVDGFFVIHLPTSREWREIVKAECERQRLSEYPCDQTDYGIADAGSRKWVPSKLDLPAMAGGGCLVVRIHQSAAPQETSEPQCNGPH